MSAGPAAAPWWGLAGEGWRAVEALQEWCGRHAATRDREDEGGPHHGPGAAHSGPGGRRQGRGRGGPRGWPGPGGWGGPGPWGGFPFGGPPGWFGRRPRAGRGDVRSAILLLLAEGPQHGYQLLQAIAERTEGAWRPSPGSVYPTLAQLEDEGLVRAVTGEGRRTFELTDEGRAYVDANRDDLSAVWDTGDGGGDDTLRDLASVAASVAAAVAQVARAGSAQQQAEARRVLADTRRALYRILAGDEPAPDGDGPGGDGPGAAS